MVFVPGSVVILFAQIFRQCPLHWVTVDAVMTESAAIRAMFNAIVVIDGDGVDVFAKLPLCLHRLFFIKPAFWNIQVLHNTFLLKTSPSIDVASKHFNENFPATTIDNILKQTNQADQQNNVPIVLEMSPSDQGTSVNVSSIMLSSSGLGTLLGKKLASFFDTGLASGEGCMEIGTVLFWEWGGVGSPDIV